MSDLEDETVLNHEGDEHEETEELEERPRKHSRRRDEDEEEEDEEDEDEDEEDEEDEGVERGKKRSKVCLFPGSPSSRILTGECSIDTINVPPSIVSSMSKPRLMKTRTRRRMKMSMREVRP